MDRRTFVYQAALGTLSFGLVRLKLHAADFTLRDLHVDLQAPALPPTPRSMPGLFPGRVVEAYHSGSIVNRRVSQPAVKEMVERGMKALDGESAGKDAWARFFEPSDVVALKVNPSGTPWTTTSMPLVREVIQALNAIGVPNKNIIIYDRNSNQLEVNGYHVLVPPGVRVAGLDERWTIKGETRTGYDRDVYCEMDCFGERETRWYLWRVVSSDANKIINLPTLKQHNASGVTGCLKNLAYGTFNNVDRTHTNPKTYTDPVIAIKIGRAHV